jgi:hypothetical protein
VPLGVVVGGVVKDKLLQQERNFREQNATFRQIVPVPLLEGSDGPLRK